VLWLLAALSLISAFAGQASAQNRMSDKDVSQRMKNLMQDVKKFRSSFNSSVSKSTIRKTSQEKDAKQLVEAFQDQIRDMYDKFKSSKKSDPYLQNCLENAQQIDKLVAHLALGGMTTDQWSRVQSELTVLATVFHMPPH
jgi:nitrate/nitrite-specific signal transduction histidine kinase